MNHDLLTSVVRDFEELAAVLERAIVNLARDQRASVDVEALKNARDAAVRGAEAARKVLRER